MTIAVLALQGAFLEHEKMLKRLGADCFEIRQAADLNKPFDGLIIPGGESTTIRKLLTELGLYDFIKERIISKMPVFGTCAGLITLAKKITGDVKNPDKSLEVMDITACRNGYGRQLGSFFAKSDFAGKEIPMTFIRAPYIESVGEDVEVLSEVDGKIVAARENNMLVTAFHPELLEDRTVHEYFLEMVKNAKYDNK